MTKILEQPRRLCALGAQQTVSAIEGGIPILHAGPGCGYKLHLGLGFFNGFQGGGYSGGSAMPCTNTGEKEVVFGGEDRLRSTIDGALKVMRGDLFVVLSGCTSELVGDDSENIVQEYRAAGVPIAYAATAGFRGSNLLGHEIVVRAILDQLVAPGADGEKVPGLVNLWASVPSHDPFWSGNLLAAKELLEGIGLEVNVLFGPASCGLSAWKRVPSAQFNLVLSSWVGVETARNLETRYGTPYLHYPVLPSGGIETSRFLRTVAEFAGIPSERAEAYIQKQEAVFHFHYERMADFFMEFRWDLPESFSVVADSFYGAGIGRLLTGEFGLLPSAQVVTDEPPEEFHPAIRKLYENLAPEISAEVTFSGDGEDIRKALRQAGSPAPLILGSTWDREIARELGACHLSIAGPITDRLTGSCSYFGYYGGLRLIEDIYSSILNSIQ
jgi:nitrogenase molybdenum-iron protein beta chain